MIEQVARFYDNEPGSRKGIVYFEKNMKKQMLKKFKKIPDINSFENVLEKFVKYLNENKLWIDAKI